MSVRFMGAAIAALLTFPILAHGQAQDADNSWHVMQDAVVTGMFNHQGGPRGGDEFRVPNWWMGMFTRPLKSGQLTINAMLSLDPATVGKKGYREIFQVGEAFEGRPLIDYQHPHDLFMQLAAVWRIPVGTRTGFTIAGAPSGEPAVGPVAFMHRASAAENPLAPLSHHTFDSTHIAFGVVTAAVDHGPWTFETSMFNGREPDEDRWGFDFRALDSVAGRTWFRPTAEWEFQFSSARLKNPEELGHSNIVRTTGSGAWFKQRGEDFTAATFAIGVNATEEADRTSLLAEATRRVGANVVFGRAELVQVETAVLANSARVPHDAKDSVGALTLGGLRDIGNWKGFQGGVGASVTFYAVPARLEATHGHKPVSFQLFVRFRPPVGAMGRMWNMHMIKPMQIATSADPAHKH